MASTIDTPRANILLPAVDETAARRSLLDQIARLESELGAMFCSVFPRTGFDWSVPSRGGPRMLDIGELEELRDGLAERLRHIRRSLNDRTYLEQERRALIERMLLEPARYKWVRVRNEDIGERGCKECRSVPRLGPIGLLLGWWRVKISSGCPLATARAPLRPGSDD
ncbi:MAG TPA: hypothetical protein VNT32_10085 [Thermoleophilaceae bacterium]|nr:hypothetical protein [Thermoleophilaceae bacterium]